MRFNDLVDRFRSKPSGPSDSPLAAWWANTNLSVQRAFYRSSLSVSTRVRVYKRLALILKNNVPLAEAVAEMYVILARRSQAFDKEMDLDEQVREMLAETPRDPGALLMQDILRACARGRSIADAFAPWVTDQEQSLIRSGEKTARLVQAFNRCVFALKKRQQLTKALRSALMMPALLIVGLVGAVIFVAFDLVPQYLQLMPVEEWTGQTRTLIDIGLFTRHWVFLIIPALVGLVTLITLSMPRWTGLWRDYADRFPPYSIYRMFQGSVFMLNVAALMGSGDPVESALQTMLVNTTPYLRERIRDALRGLAKGLNLGQALHHAEHGFPDPDAIGFMRILASRSGFAEALEGSIEEWLDESIDTIVAMANVVRLFAICTGGWFIVLMFKAMYGLRQAAEHMH
jgi:type II secretory pathway component PulF